MLIIEEIPWPAQPDTLKKNEHGEFIVGQFTVGIVFDTDPTEWGYYDSDGNCLGLFATSYEAINEGALRDDYRGEDE